jgi:SWIM zinc finger
VGGANCEERKRCYATERETVRATNGAARKRRESRTRLEIGPLVFPFVVLVDLFSESSEFTLPGIRETCRSCAVCSDLRASRGRVAFSASRLLNNHERGFNDDDGWKTRVDCLRGAGSSPEPYRVIFERKYAEVRAFCTCAAGQNGLYCKHRIHLLQGVVDEMVAGDLEKLSVLADWLRDSRLGFAVQQFDAAELALEQAKRRVSNARKALSSAMQGKYKGNE